MSLYAEMDVGIGLHLENLSATRRLAPRARTELPIGASGSVTHWRMWTGTPGTASRSG
jgi:hypothetical protein